MSERQREQCWVINNEVVEPRPASAPTQEELVEKQEAGALEADGDPAPALRRASGARTAISEVRRSSGQFREVTGVFVRRELLNTVHTPPAKPTVGNPISPRRRAAQNIQTVLSMSTAPITTATPR